jgi:hypothetical protein
MAFYEFQTKQDVVGHEDTSENWLRAEFPVKG